MKSTEEFIEQAKRKHNNKYDYSKTEYKGSKEKICIICPIHGEFWQEANSHLKGCGCYKCRNKVFDTKSFIEESQKKHGDKYDYSKVEYVNTDTKVCIVCHEKDEYGKEHGDFWQRPNNHLNGKGCNRCNKIHRYSTNEFVAKLQMIYGDKYDYSKVKYVNADTKICVICPIHGEFWIYPAKMLSGSGCGECNKLKNRKSREEFIKNANQIHNNKYDYSKVEYVNNKTKVCIICPKHGEFWQIPNTHLRGGGCKLCGDMHKGEKKRHTIDELIEKFHMIYQGKYKYDFQNFIYKNVEQKIPIICEEHGVFYKTVHKHLNGEGCPKCVSSCLENEIRIFLQNNNIEFEEEKKFEWLKYKSNLRLDFYLPQFNIAIECQGEQHFYPILMYGGKKGFQYQQTRDRVKKQLCENHGINILYYGKHKHNGEIITQKNDLLKKILLNG